VSVTDDFRRLSVRAVDDLLRADPVSATWLGDHRFDDQLPDLSGAAVAARLTMIDDHVTALDAVDDVELGVTDQVDLEILRAQLLRSRFDLGERRSHTWDPMVWNPGTGVHLLLSREFAPGEQRRASLRGRLAAIPDTLADARSQLGQMSRIHVETAVAQLEGTRALIDGEARSFVGADAIVDEAAGEIVAFAEWLTQRLETSDRDPRLGEHLYSAALWHSLDHDTSASQVLADAESHLAVLGDELRDVAARYLGRSTASAEDVREALESVALRAPVTDATVLADMQWALERTTAFVREIDLVEVPDVDVRVIEMPEIHRGVAVAYCDAPGPLEAAHVPTFVAVAPTPSGWDTDRVRSFYREYNGVQLHGLTVHEAMPGHVLQLAHAQRLVSPTPVRRFGHSGTFVEGWAVFAEQLMVARGYRPDDEPAAGLAMRLQQLKMQARCAINAILDVGVHAHGMTEDEGLAMMRDHGFQEEGEAVGKWRRALLTAGQLPTYFVGFRAVAGIDHDLRVLHPEWTDRQINDLMLSHGSPAPRHLRTLLGI
jgi:uncharacterized protein (DUF885 family)